MLLLDENIMESQRQQLLDARFHIRQIGVDFSDKGILDEQIIPLLHQQRHATFFTRDQGFYDRKLCHPRYCLVCLTLPATEVAFFVRRFLRDMRFKTRAQRMGLVIRLSSAGIQLWRRREAEEASLDWTE